MFSDFCCHILAPAEPVIEYITRTFHGAADLKSVYKGTPRKELDDAWDRLVPGSGKLWTTLQGSCWFWNLVLPGPTLRISEEELGLIGKDATEDAAVKIPAEFGGGYWATLEVFHQLHCLVSPECVDVMIKEYWPPSRTSFELLYIESTITRKWLWRIHASSTT